MAVLITMLRGINVGGRHMISMGALRELYQSLGLRDVETYLQSGNVICRTDAQDLALLSKRIESGIERKFGFRPDVIIRRPSDLRKVIARNPFAGRRDIDPSKFLVTFLARDPGAEARDQVRTIKTDPEDCGSKVARSTCIFRMAWRARNYRGRSLRRP